MELHAALYGVLLPVAVVAAVLAVLRALRGWCAWLGSARVVPLALAAAAIWSAWQQAGRPPWQPAIAAEWLPASFAATAVLGALVVHGGGWRTSGRHGCGWRGALSAAVPAAAGVGLLSPPGVSMGTRVALAAAAGLAGACAAPAFAALPSLPASPTPAASPAPAASPSPAASPTPAASPAPAASPQSPQSPRFSSQQSSPPRTTFGAPLAMWGTAAALSGLALQAGSAKLAIVAGAFSAMAAAVGVLGLIMRPMPLGAPTAAAWAGMLGALAAMCLGYADEAEPTTCWWLMVLSPAGAGLACVPAVSARLALHQRPALRAVMVAAPPLIMALAAVASVALRSAR